MFIDSLQVFGFILLSGYALPMAQNRTNADFLLGVFAQGLWVCMVVGYVRFLTGLPAEAFLGALVVIAALRLFYRPLQAMVDVPSGWRWPLVSGGGYFVFLALVGAVALVAGLDTELVPRGAFMRGDGIVSFNRWALEFVRFEYAPQAAYYPTGFPAAWSVLYDLQDSVDLWFFPLMLMIGLLVLPVFVFGCFIAERRWGVAVVFASAISVISLGWARRITDGGMDFPVSLLLFLGLFWTLLALPRDQPLDIRRLTTGFCLLSVAAVTKQPGLVGLAFGIALLMVLGIRKNIGYRSGVYLLAVLLMPTLLSGYVFYQSGANPIGNLEGLRALADSRTSSIAGSLSYLASLSNLPVLGVLVGAGIWSIARGGHSRIFSLVCLLIAVAGFIAFHDCCSYSARNSVWIYAFLFAAAAPIGLTWRSSQRQEPVAALSARQAIGGTIGVMFCIVAIVTALNAVVPIRQAEAYFRDRIGGLAMHKMLKRNIGAISQNGVLSFYPSLSFSTLVGPYHGALRAVTEKGLFVENLDAKGYHPSCESPSSGLWCTVSAVLEERPCAHFMLVTGHDRHFRIGGPQRSARDTYGLVPVDTNKAYELLVSSKTCPQPQG